MTVEVFLDNDQTFTPKVILLHKKMIFDTLIKFIKLPK